MPDATVKRPSAKRKHARPITAWVTPQQEALLNERAMELDVDRSTLLRAGLWLCVLQPAMAKIFLTQADVKGGGSAAAATSPSPSGSRPNLTMLFKNYARRQAEAAATSSAPSSPPSYLIDSEISQKLVTQRTYWVLSDAGGWHTPRPTNQRKSLRRRGLRVVCGGGKLRYTAQSQLNIRVIAKGRRQHRERKRGCAPSRPVPRPLRITIAAAWADNILRPRPITDPMGLGLAVSA